MKATLTFSLPEERTEFERASNALSLVLALEDVSETIFRPARKHGYPDKDLQELIEKIGEPAGELIGILEQMYRDIIDAHSVWNLLNN